MRPEYIEFAEKYLMGIDYAKAFDLTTIKIKCSGCKKIFQFLIDNLYGPCWGRSPYVHWFCEKCAGPRLKGVINGRKKINC